MMINKRLINTVKDSKKYIIRNVIAQFVALIFNIAMILFIGLFLQNLLNKRATKKELLITILIIILNIAVKAVCTVISGKMSFKSSESVKKILREKIYCKILKLGASYTQSVSSAEVVQLSSEGVEQLESYFGSYLPQLFFSLIAPVTLFATLSFISFKSALILILCVPLIPVSIIAVQKFAKKLLAKYWGQYATLGDSFLENLQGLTTLKIYKSDEYKNNEMNKEAENFRKITMKVLTMQLNSITIMDLIAYGGAAIGVILSIAEFQRGNIGFMGCFAIIMLSADFFLPLRLLGSFFHIAMNGMAASDKIFKLLDLTEASEKGFSIDNNTHYDIICKDISFSYDNEKEILKNINMEFRQGQFISIVGESGCGKSTIASILMGINNGYKGSVRIGGVNLNNISTESLMKNITLVSLNSYLFKGTVRYNLLMGNPHATDEEMWKALKCVNFDGFLRNENGLETKISEKALNFSGGQCQRLSIARALLHNSKIYIFDEATSNIDVESENEIMNVIYSLKKDKTVILISHRLANVVNSDKIYVLKKGRCVESGTHNELIKNNNVYSELWNIQQDLERYIGGKLHEAK